MGCGCVKESKARRAAIRKLAVAHAQGTGGVVVFYRCTDYDFAPLEAFTPAGKAEVEYII
jgi:hypothetical protein